MIIHDAASVAQLIDQMEQELSQQIAQRKMDDYLIVGIQTGGAWVAEALHKRLKNQHPLGTLNISFYRDDFSTNGLNPTIGPSQLPIDIEEQHIILVDDVIMSGRTIRAALNELFDYGRPKSVLLATLVSMEFRQLPIQPDVAGITLALQNNQRVKLKGPSPLHIELKAL